MNKTFEIEYLYRGFKRFERYEQTEKLDFFLRHCPHKGIKLSKELKKFGFHPTNRFLENGEVVPAIQHFGALVEGKRREWERFYMENGQLNDYNDQPAQQVRCPIDGHITRAFSHAMKNGAGRKLAQDELDQLNGNGKVIPITREIA